MESWWILIALSIFTFFLIRTRRRRGRGHLSLPLPPGPPTIPILGSFVLLRKSFAELEPVLRRLHSHHGPLVSLRIGHRPAVFVADRTLAHRALVHHGAVFASRPPSTPVARVFNRGQHNISGSDYGSVWRALRRNLTAEILHPSRASAYGPARRWVLGVLTDRLEAAQVDEGDQAGVEVVGHFQYAMFCLLVLMCFGDKLDEPVIRDIERVQRNALLSFGRFGVLNFWPALTKILFRSRWRDLRRLRTDQEAVLIPLIESRMRQNNAPAVPCYVDTLLNLQLPADHENRKLSIGDIMNLCSEFLNAGTDTTSTVLQWVMVNLVKHPEIQERVYAELKEAASVAGDRVEVFSEEEVGKLRYLRAVVVETLRRHPPGHFVLPHAVSEDIELGGYRIPKDGTVNFMVAEMGLDPAVWEDPLTFKPERFLRDDSEGEEQIIHHITKGSGETIKMMPFGAGRRICPGSGLALLHLQYFVANLVWTFQWNADPNHPPDLAEKQEFTVVMKHPLRARLTPRRLSA